MTCAFAVRGALKKIAGVESVDVSLNQGLASMKLRPGNPIALSQVWETIKRSGFTTKDTHVIVRGEVIEASGGPHLKLTGTGQVLNLVPDPKATQILERVKKDIGKTVIIEGRMTPVAIEVQAVRDDGQKGK